MDRVQGISGVSGVEPLGVPRNLLRDAVFARLLTSILSGEYRRGQRLRLDEIASDLGVSRTPVREALVPLEALRLVIVQRYVGVVIAHWSIDNMVERLRLVRRLLLDPPVPGAIGSEPLDPIRVQDAESEAGVACVLAEWALRRTGCPVSADLVAAMRPLLDMVFSETIARRHGIDIANGRGPRLVLLDRAHARASAGDVDGTIAATAELVEQLASVPARFRPSVLPS